MLKKIPGFSPNTSDLNDTLVEYLKRQRFEVQVNTRKRSKRTRLTIAPGVSVTGGSQGHDSASDCEEAPVESDDETTSHHEDDDDVEHLQPILESIHAGSYIVVKVLSGKRKSVVFKYVAIVQEIKEETKEYSVMGLKSIDTGKTVFKVVEDDVFVIGVDDILAVLPNPKVESSGDRVRYRFDGKIDVKEC